MTNLVSYEQPSFVEYLNSGWQISLCVAIDYTLSNGEPHSAFSLHSLRGNNQYLMAIDSVGRVLEPYDSDRSFPVFGFGGINPLSGQTSHCFPINGKPDNPEVFGVDGIIEAYKSSLRTVQLSGPTYFSPLLAQYLGYVQQFTDTNQYQVLLILTDGEIFDMD